MPTNDRAQKRGNGVRVRTKRSSKLDREYMITPNALLRGEGVYTVLSSFGRLLLAAGLSCGDHETTLDEMREWIPELGRNRHEALRRELREHGFLKLYRSVVPAGQPDAGSFVWTFEFLMEPLPADERDQLQTRKPRPAPAVRKPPRAGSRPRPTKPSDQPDGDKPAGHTMPPKPGHGDPFEHVNESAGGTMPPKPGHGDPGHGDPGPGVGGDVSKEEKNRSIKEPPPPYPPDVAVVTPEPKAAGAGGKSDEKSIDLVEACVDDVKGVRPEWSRTRVVQAVRSALIDGRDPEITVAAMRLVAADPDTRTPGRLNEEGDWWTRAAEALGLRTVAAGPPVWCDEHVVKLPPGQECPLCTRDGRNGAPGASGGPDGGSELDPAVAGLRAATRERLVKAGRL